MHFDLGPAFRFLDKADARRVLESYWGNPPDDDVLGLIVPRQPALDESLIGWAVPPRYDTGSKKLGARAGVRRRARLRHPRARPACI
ncbi:DUF2167 domain-containing protein [Pantoea ananatis]|nr:DUF2167 domain-containing protein [Pantoea ananatis]